MAWSDAADALPATSGGPSPATQTQRAGLGELFLKAACLHHCASGRRVRTGPNESASRPDRGGPATHVRIRARRRDSSSESDREDFYPGSGGWPRRRLRAPCPTQFAHRCPALRLSAAGATEGRASSCRALCLTNKEAAGRCVELRTRPSRAGSGTAPGRRKGGGKVGKIGPIPPDEFIRLGYIISYTYLSYHMRYA